MSEPACAMTPTTLTIAGSDPSGGAGIQADLKTFAGCGVYGASIITALTAQNTRGVTDIHAVPPAFIASQFNALFSDLHIAAAKTGMLGTGAIIDAVAAGLDRGEAADLTLVVDPVMVATSGDPLLSPDAEHALAAKIIPRAAVLTPNLDEALRLVGRQAAPQGLAELIDLASELGSLGARSVLLKGGHVDGNFDGGTDKIEVDHIQPAAVDTPVAGISLDLLAHDGELRGIAGPRYQTGNTHGTGCTLSAAIAALLTHGSAIPQACINARQFVSDGIAFGARMRVGKGSGPLDHVSAGRTFAAIAGVKGSVPRSSDGSALGG